jgi:hypothetical protein
MIDKMNQIQYNDPCTIALETDKLFMQIDDMYRETLCVEEQLSNQEYLDKIDRKLYERSQGY